MGIYEQPNSWQCGPFALKHALLARGVFVHEGELTRVAGSTEAHGTDEIQLMRAARAFGGVLQTRRYRTARGARHALARLLAEQVPVLLCVDQWDHWVTAVGADHEHVAVFDTHYREVLRLEPWEPLLHRLGYRHRVRFWPRPVAWYDLHPLYVRGETGLRLALTPPLARRVLAAPEGYLASLDDYARQLMPFVARNGHRAGSFALAPWLSEHAQNGGSAHAPVLETLALTAEVFGARGDARGARGLVYHATPAPQAGACAPSPSGPRQRVSAAVGA